MSTREERAEATRAQLIAVARELFATRGYADVGTEDVVRAAGLTRGALYHHFADKRELFAAVHEQLEQDLVAESVQDLPGLTDPLELFTIGVRRFLDACSEPAVLQVSLLDAPTVLGWARWREVGERYALGVMIAALSAAMDAGRLRPMPVRPLAHVLVAAFAEAALLIAHSDDRTSARADVEPTLLALLDGLRADKPAAQNP